MTRDLHAYAYLERPFDQIRIAFSGELIDVLEQARGAAVKRAITVSQRLEAKIGPLEVGREVVVEPSGYEQTPREAEHPSARLRLSWRAASAESLFPTMDAQLVAQPLGPGETELALFGRYTPPFGRLGALGDAVLGRRVAEASVRSFLDEVVRQLSALIPPSDSPPE